MIDSYTCCRGWRKDGDTIEHALGVAERQGVCAIFDDGYLSRPAVNSRGVCELRLAESDKCYSPVLFGLLAEANSNPWQMAEMIGCYNDFTLGNGRFRNAAVVGFKMPLDLLNLEDSLKASSLIKHLKLYSYFSQLAMSGYEGPVVIDCEEENRTDRNLFKAVLDRALEAGFKGNLHFFPVSTPKSVRIIQEIKKSCSGVSCGTDFAHLLLDRRKFLEEDGFHYLMKPSLRSPKVREELFECFKAGEIDILASGHMPCSYSEKVGGVDEKGKPLGLEKAGINNYGIPALASWRDVLDICFERGVDMGLMKAVTYDHVNRVFGINLQPLERRGAELPPDQDDKNSYIIDAFARLLGK